MRQLKVGDHVWLPREGCGGTVVEPETKAIAKSLAALSDYMIALDGGGFTTVVCQRGQVTKIGEC
jgi:hypothetical protein